MVSFELEYNIRSKHEYMIDPIKMKSSNTNEIITNSTEDTYIGKKLLCNNNFFR